MKEAKTIKEILDEVSDDVVIEFVNEEHKVTHLLRVYWTRKNGFPMLPQEVLNKPVKFFIKDNLDNFIIYC